MTNWLLGILLGLVQGISEWLPVSSKTQIIIVSTYVYHFPFTQAYAFGLFLEAGSFVAAVVFFRSEVLRVLKALVGRGDEEGRLLLKFLVVVTLVTALIGVGIYALIAENATGPVLGVPMVLLGLILIGDGAVIHFARGRQNPRKGLKDLTMRDLLLVGVAQGIAALPGVSRSGVTVSAMLLLGINPRESFRLSFLALIPSSIGAALVTVILSNLQISSAISAITPPVLLLALVVTVAVGLVLIRVLLRAASSPRITILVVGLGVLAILSGVVTILTGFG
ncbi:MAG TPA: undecaprenyl-diphosphate phosphatase [Nitrososphaerales archaeon]|nr:undecaprenyl-diphosphate phosphatase [Nitrososphaerales archaeon]